MALAWVQILFGKDPPFPLSNPYIVKAFAYDPNVWEPVAGHDGDITAYRTVTPAGAEVILTRQYSESYVFDGCTNDSSTRLRLTVDGQLVSEGYRSGATRHYEIGQLDRLLEKVQSSRQVENYYLAKHEAEVTRVRAAQLESERLHQAQRDAEQKRLDRM